MWRFLFIFGFLATVLAQDHPNQLSKGEDGLRKGSGELRNTVFKKYDPKSLPIKSTKKMTITLSLEPIFIRLMCELEQVLYLDAYLVLRWKDDFLRWNPESHHNVDKLVVPSTDIWTPDVTAGTLSSESKFNTNPQSKVIVHSSGEVTWMPQVTLTTFCPMNLTKYPNDIHICPLHLHSQSYDASLLEFVVLPANLSLTKFQDTNRIWSMESIGNQLTEVRLPCCLEDSFSAVEYDLVLRRRKPRIVDFVDKMSYYAVFMALLMFWLPPDSLHKVILGALSEILLWIGLFHLSETIPVGVTATSAGKRICPIMCLVAGAMFAEVLVISMARMMVHCRPSRCLLGIARCCCQPFCICASRAYSSQDPRTASHTDKSNKKHVATAQDEWNVIASACDRLLFFAALLGTVFLFKFYNP